MHTASDRLRVILALIDYSGALPLIVNHSLLSVVRRSVSICFRSASRSVILVAFMGMAGSKAERRLARCTVLYTIF